jgi:diguanylate cyclase (GGDEF)-like protein
VAPLGVHIAGSIRAVNDRKEGFSFIMTSNGDILGLREEHYDMLGVRPKEGQTSGVTTTNINIFSSNIPSFANMEIPGSNEDFKIYNISDKSGGYYFVLRSYANVFQWDGKAIEPLRFFVGVIVPKSEAMFIKSAIQEEINSASSSSVVLSLLTAFIICTFCTALAVLVVSHSTKQIKLLTIRAKALEKGDFKSQVPVISHDEMGQLALAFNSMSLNLSNSQKQIQAHAENLERVVAQRTLELENANKLLEDLSLTDSLTGLGNRRRFDESLSLLWSLGQREGGGLALILFDVDFFKQYNDRYGHQSGDACLKRIADATRRCTRRDLDLLCRYGGEEFVVLLRGDKEEAILLGERIRQAVADEQIPHDQGVCSFVTVSLGGAYVESFATDSPEMLLSRADNALYQSKHGGRNCMSML